MLSNAKRPAIRERNIVQESEEEGIGLSVKKGPRRPCLPLLAAVLGVY